MAAVAVLDQDRVQGLAVVVAAGSGSGSGSEPRDKFYNLTYPNDTIYRDGLNVTMRGVAYCTYKKYENNTINLVSVSYNFFVDGEYQGKRLYGYSIIGGESLFESNNVVSKFEVKAKSGAGEKTFYATFNANVRLSYNEEIDDVEGTGNMFCSLSDKPWTN